MRQACAAGGGSSKPVSSAAVEKCEGQRKPEAFFGHRKADQIPPCARRFRSRRLRRLDLPHRTWYYFFTELNIVVTSREGVNIHGGLPKRS